MSNEREEHELQVRKVIERPPIRLIEYATPQVEVTDTKVPLSNSKETREGVGTI